MNARIRPLLAFGKKRPGIVFFLFSQLCILLICPISPPSFPTAEFIWFQFVLSSLLLFYSPILVSWFYPELDKKILSEKWISIYPCLQLPLLVLPAWLLAIACAGGFYSFSTTHVLAFGMLAFSPIPLFVIGYTIWLMLAKKTLKTVTPTSSILKSIFYFMAFVAGFFAIAVHLVVALFPFFVFGYGA